MPHFEKMLSDQALLARAYLRAARAVPEHPEWREVALDTINFVLRRPRRRAAASPRRSTPTPGVVEGSHVTWTTDEVAAALQRGNVEADLAATLRRWRITSPGSFEGRSIPRLADGEPFTTPDALAAARASLRAARARRAQPTRDEKVILEWNAMFASALLEVRESTFTEAATSLLSALHRSHFRDGAWWRTDDRRAYASAE